MTVPLSVSHCLMTMMSPIVRFVFASAGIALVVGTAADFAAAAGTKFSFFVGGCSEKMVSCFSLKKNVASLMTTKTAAAPTAASKREFFGFFSGMRYASSNFLPETRERGLLLQDIAVHFHLQNSEHLENVAMFLVGSTNLS